MKEELKQAIEEAKIKIPYDLSIVYKVLCTPSILRHADPEIMKQAGWVDRSSLIDICHDVLTAYQKANCSISKSGLPVNDELEFISDIIDNHLPTT